ncbi:RidA family protein [Paracoccus aestuariivivens]|uniref:RidA family protein n=1 Tax=Paracoccus aestuariivivens TaxID=1820333 RepID=A0A6L6JIP2_9RHOB|nr:RidA family protein [Paracoccus aestuariivivens]MTH80004.1 RidA family protein [Paracoccus aestuariivivens]
MTNPSAVERLGVGPRMSQVNIARGETIYLAGQVAKTAAGAPVREQMAEILANIDTHLAAAGSTKENILQATILLTDMAGFDEMNTIWDAWVAPGQAPGRACFQAPLNRPGLDVEVIVVAAR